MTSTIARIKGRGDGVGPVEAPDDDHDAGQQRAGEAVEVGQDVAVVHLQVVAVKREQARPVESLGDEPLSVKRWLRLLVGHLQEEEVRELLDVVSVGEPVVAQDVAVAPQALDEAV